MQSYLLVRQKGHAIRRGVQKSVRMPLPLTIGTSAHADIIINSQALMPVSYEITAVESSSADAAHALRITAMKDGSQVDASELRRLGLDVKGPFSVTARTLDNPLRRRVSELLVLERQWFARLPERARKCLGGDLKQQLRLPVWGAIVTGLLALVMMRGKAEVHPDLSMVPQPLKAGVIERALHGASPKRLGYEKGVLFHIEGFNARSKSQLRFDVGGLDEDKEVEVVFNGKSLYATKADVSCVESFCSRTVTLPASERAELFFRHNGNGNWLIRNILVRDLVAITPAEAASVSKWLDGARRAWVDRSVSAENIVFASEQIAKAEELAAARSGADQLMTDIQVLKQEVEGSFTEIVKDLTFKVRKDLKLGDLEEAKKSLQLMLRLYPDPAHPEHRRLKQILKETEGMQ